MGRRKDLTYDEGARDTIISDNSQYYKRLFMRFKKENPNLIRYGTHWSPYGYYAIEVFIPRVGKLVYNDGGIFEGTIEWKEHWSDEKAEKAKEREMRPEMYQNFLREIYGFQKFYELTQGDIAEMTGVSRKSINRYLSGAVAPKVSTMRKICEALDIDI